ncbi:aldo/keto reductase, partial [Achromobacter ruhlandii]
MNYRRLGSSNLRVSPLCLGTMMFGEQTPDDEAARIVASARDHGLNFIDTADVYNDGRSEQVVGKLLQGQRHDWVLASKIGNVVGKGPNQSHYSRQWLIRGVEQSLARLGTDFLDILYLHRDYHEENLEEALWALGDLIRAGKLRSFGLSNFRGWRIAETLRLCEKLGVPQPVVCQPYYNMLNRGPEVEILPACQHYGLGVVPYSPIARGVLTGKYLPGQAPAADTRAGRGDRRILATEFREESLRIAQRLVEHSAARGVQPGHFAT